jgi:hypothetical protein
MRCGELPSAIRECRKGSADVEAAGAQLSYPISQEAAAYGLQVSKLAAESLGRPSCRPRVTSVPILAGTGATTYM